MIIKTFRQVGLSLNPDGSEDLEIKIKDLEGIEVGKWELEVDVSQEEDEDSTALEAVLEAEKTPKLLLVPERNNEKQEINITKASLRSRAGNQYFTAEEADTGDPLIVNNEEDITTDSNTGSEDGNDDSDESFDTDGDNSDLEDHMME
jgi:hypothetical protein